MIGTNRQSNTFARRWTRHLASAALAAMLALVAAPAPAAIPSEISYQAYLTAPTGLPIISNDVTVQLDFYDAVTGGALLHTVTFTGQDLSASQGFVNLTVPLVVVGPPSELSATELNNPIWIEVTVTDVANAGAPETLLPRQKISSAPIATNADYLDGLDSTDFALLNHKHSSLDASDGSPTDSVTIDTEGEIGLNSLVILQNGIRVDNSTFSQMDLSDPASTQSLRLAFGTPGRVALRLGNTLDTDGDDFVVTGGDVFSGNGNGGDVVLQPGLGSGSGINGSVFANGDLSITGKATQTVLTPTAAGDLVPKDYLDTAFANFTNTVFVKPSGTVSASPTGTINDPFNSLTAAYAYAKTLPGAGSFFDRIAIIVLPGRHTLTSQLVMDTVGIDLVGLGNQVAFIQDDNSGSFNPMIDLTAPTAGASIQGLNLQAQNSTIVPLRVGSGRIERCAFRRSSGTASLLTINTGSGQSLSVTDFSIFGNVDVQSYGTQTTMYRGFITGSLTSTANSGAATDILAIMNVDAIGSISFNPTVAGQIALNNIPSLNGVSWNTNAVVRAASVNFATTAGVPLALPNAATGSLIANSIGDNTALLPGTVASSGNIATVFIAFFLK